MSLQLCFVLICHSHISHITPCFPPKFLHKHCLHKSVSLGTTVIPSWVINNKGWAKFLGGGGRGMRTRHEMSKWQITIIILLQKLKRNTLNRQKKIYWTGLFKLSWHPAKSSSPDKAWLRAAVWDVLISLKEVERKQRPQSREGSIWNRISFCQWFYSLMLYSRTCICDHLP